VIELLKLLWLPTLQTLFMVFVSALLSSVSGLLLGVLLIALRPSGVHPAPTTHKALSIVVNVGRSLPFIILMVAITPLTRLLTGSAIGVGAAIVPLTIGAIPFVARLVENALQEVPTGVIEAAITMGASTKQIIRKVYLPEARPSLIRAYTVVAITLVGYSAMAGAVGGGGLGDLAIRCGYQGFRLDVMIATVLAMIVIIQGLQWSGDALAARAERGRAASSSSKLRTWTRWSAAVALMIALLTLGVAHYKQNRVKPLRIGVNPIPHGEILQFLQPELKRQGVELEIVYFTDYIQPNLALSSGDLDANLFQHKPFLDRFNHDHGTRIVPIANVHIEPLGLYPGRAHSLAALTNESEIGVPNDPVNLGRALAVLQSAGLIKLRTGVSIGATQQDIVDNPKRLRIRELEAAQLPRSLPDLDAAVINTNYALSIGLNPLHDALFLERSDSPYANLLATTPEKANDPRLAKLVEALHSEQTRQFILQKYKGAILPAF